LVVAAKQKSRILIFGTGSGGSHYYKGCRSRYNVIGFLDNNQQKHGQVLFGKTIYAPGQLNSLVFDQIIIASDYYREIYPQLINELAIAEEKISIFHKQLSSPRIRERLTVRLERWAYALMCHSPGPVADLLLRLLFSRQDEVRLFQLCWLDEAATSKVHVFRPARPGCVQGPRYLGCDVPTTSITLPEVALYQFRNGEVCSVSRSVLLPGERLIAERVVTAKTADADYSAAHLIYHGRALALTRPAARTEKLDKGLLINGGSEVNYYHWVLEILSQLQFIRELPSRYDDFPILMSGNSQNIPAIKALIEAIEITRPIVFLKSIAAYCVTDLLLISAPNNFITNFKGSAYGLAEYSFARPESIMFLREHALALSAGVARDTLPKRIFLGRKGFLRPYNQAQILALLEPSGFVCIYMEEQDIHQQVAIMANADVIIGPTGAAWTNIIFASEGVKALCWMAEEVGEVSCFSNLAAIVGVQMDYIAYNANTSDTREIYYKEYSVDAQAIASWSRNACQPVANNQE
jgi:capsular polysaccharide biosynthesis protein